MHSGLGKYPLTEHLVTTKDIRLIGEDNKAHFRLHHIDEGSANCTRLNLEALIPTTAFFA